MSSIMAYPFLCGDYPSGPLPGFPGVVNPLLLLGPGQILELYVEAQNRDYVSHFVVYGP